MTCVVRIYDVFSPYTELNASGLKIQLQLFGQKRPTKSVDETARALRATVPETGGEYSESEMEQLVHILLVCRASSAEAEKLVY